MGEKETAIIEGLDAESGRTRTGNLMHLDDDRGEARATSVKSSKSNTSDRSVAGFEAPDEAEAVKSGKSNSSDRSTGADESANARATTVKSGKSNSSE